MDAIRLSTPREVRATIARHVLGDDADALVGDIRLHPHQLDAVGRLRRMISGHGGALLADDVGLGKTYVALAVARDARAPVIFSPAALRSTWQAALGRARLTARWHSIESLSFASPPDPGDLVIIDEAHHLRNPSTRRFAAAAMFCRNSSVLLLSATPVQNRIDDLRTLLSLFLGARARGMHCGLPFRLGWARPLSRWSSVLWFPLRLRGIASSGVRRSKLGRV